MIYFSRYFFLFFFIFQLAFSQKIDNDKSAFALLGEARENMVDLKTKLSIEKCEKVLIYALGNHDDLIAASTYNIIGLNFEEFADTKRAINYYEKALNLALKVKNDTLVGAIYNNLGGIYSYNEIDMNKGLEFYKKSLYHSVLANNKEEFLYTKLNIATNLINLKRYQEGFILLKKIENEIKSLKNNETSLYYSMLIATYYNEYKNDFGIAQQYYNEAISYASKIDLAIIKLNIINLYGEMSKFYLKFSDYKNAFKYLKLHDDLEDEIYKANKAELLKEQQLSIKLSEVNNQIIKAEQVNKINLKKLKSNNIFISALIILLILFLYLLYVVYRNNLKSKLINSKLKTANIDLQIAKKKSEETAKLKTQFISTVSHELRTPLYGVIGMTDILENEFKELKDNDYFKTLKFSSKHLLNLINDVLYMYKVQEGKIELVSEKVHLESEIEIIKNLLEVIAKQNNNTITIDINQNVPVLIETDKTRLAQVIINLLSNALKFTKNGNVSIIVEKIDSIISELKFQIIDTGIGIPEEHLNSVFEKFVQLDRNNDENLQGTGLGLSIVKKIISIFGGQINIQSIENKGTNVIFTIPLITAENAEVIDDKIFEIRSDLSILVVDDNHINQIVTQKILQNNNQSCTLISNGTDAIELLKTKEFDLILMDIHMPILNGFQTSKIIREMNITTSIVALTASDKQEIQEDVSMVYLDDILVKPFNQNELLNIIFKFSK